MSNRLRVDDEVQRARALRAAAELSEGDGPAASILETPSRVHEPGRGGVPAVARAIGGLQAGAGNGAVAWLLKGGPSHRHRDGQPQVRAAHSSVADAPVIQKDANDEAASVSSTTEATGTTGATGATDAGGGDTGATELGTGAPTPGPSWTKVGPPTPTTYAVSGSLRSVSTAIAARTEAGSVTTTASADTETWAPDGGTEKVTAARVTAAQVLELPTWTDKSTATKNQQAEWDRFHGAITTHENGHVTTDKTAFAGAHSKMVGKAPADADTKLDEVDKQAKTDNATYDTGNDHGLKQGTGINPNIDEVTKVP